MAVRGAWEITAEFAALRIVGIGEAADVLGVVDFDARAFFSTGLHHRACGQPPDFIRQYAG